MKLRYQARFRLIFGLQLSVIITLVLLAYHSINSGLYPVTTGLLLCFVLLLVVQLFNYVERKFLWVEGFFRAAAAGDFSQQLGDSAYSEQLKNMFNEFNSQQLYERHKRELENNFLRALIRQAPLAIVAFDQQGALSLYNQAAEKLFTVPGAEHLNTLSRSQPELTSQLKQI